MYNELNEIDGMTFDRLMDRVLTNFPKAMVLEEYDGALTISLPYRLVDGIVTLIPEEEN